MNHILNILKKKLIVLAHVFPKRRSVLEQPFIVTMLKSDKYLWNLDESTFIMFSSLWGELITKISPLLICEILGKFVNTLTADDKYLVQDCENL